MRHCLVSSDQLLSVLSLRNLQLEQEQKKLLPQPLLNLNVLLNSPMNAQHSMNSRGAGIKLPHTTARTQIYGTLVHAACDAEVICLQVLRRTVR